MKTLFAICTIVASSLLFAAEPPVDATVKGEVLEVKEVASYTYLRIKTRDGEKWAAISKSAINKGAQVTIENVTVMNNFESKSLQKTFPTIAFGTLAGAAPKAGSVPTPGDAKPADISDARISKATGANARTVEEVISKASDLKDKPVLVHGKIVKYSPEIMGKNWIHLRDGSGSAANNTNDILVTTTGKAKPGDVVTVKGIVRTDKKFGSGYDYKVLIEEATLEAQ
jgi:hypothetical protein